MAKGENLEKPKKGGMVIVIGVGAKPKKDKTAMKKAEGRRAPRRRGSGEDNQRARIHAFKQKLRNDPYHLEELLEQKGIPSDSFEEHFHDKHGKSLDEAIEDGSVDIPQAIEEAQRIIRGNEGQFRNGRPHPNLARVLQRHQIDASDFRDSLRRYPFMNFQERIDSLRAAQDEEEGRPLTEREQKQRLRDIGLDERTVQEQLQHDERDEEDQRFRQERLEEMRDAENNIKRRRKRSKRMAEEEGEINYSRMVRVAGKLVPATIGLKAYRKRANELREELKNGYYGGANFDDLNRTRKLELAKKHPELNDLMRSVEIQTTPESKEFGQRMLNQMYEKIRIAELMNNMGYDDLETIENRANRKDGSAGQFGSLSEQEKGDYYEFLERLFSADTRLNPEVQAMRHLGMADQTSKPSFPLYRVGGSVRAAPSTVFNPETPKSFLPLPSPQEEDEEEANRYAKGNPISMAWALLKNFPPREGSPDRMVGYECKNCGGYFDAPAGLGSSYSNACPHCRKAMQHPNYNPFD